MVVTKAYWRVLGESPGRAKLDRDCCGAGMRVNRLELARLAKSEKLKSTCATTSTEYASTKRSNDSPNQPDGDKNSSTH